ncbi:ATP-dependent RNA helicase dbp4 [Coemansia spiralis]|uniref:ATP-dependent RNA helicase n=2 Tax=Coemansia TaxID=4863 RepID=A0A9W8KWY2_9FUNG|nr:P-loop containing nucleoside triphosphate hydrolase protein [Coemansia spiralis]KAJ1988631.1 ATP-dependent RNA helicase dbp4 [Coemansia umbellata]KAJ2622435.1 ATP-dependent RNA helicase dbp4 [Coemansia sp. RSA 1358]KAJ2672889.1 ATP-dependent RNA helicase dbp4 [Coemansia spiralis]
MTNPKGPKHNKKATKPTAPTDKEKRQQRRQVNIKFREDLGQRALQLATSGPLSDETKLFTELPISPLTLKGLERSHYIEMTEIQRKALPYALARRDVLGAAKTGSGKTLAFLIPVLEILYRRNWTSLDGLGALIISPTRELAVQIFEVLRKIGRFHRFSAGLVIGGKRVEEEKEIVNRMNILVCTPGRLLQHMDETAGFECYNLQTLVLDEADRILDMGFKKSMNAIIANLPQQRQTLLFSATQTKSVKDLARLSLEKPEYVGVHEKDKFSTPTKLSQYYMVVDLPQKLDMLYSFMKTHLSTKMIIFLSSCKQVRFVYETFCMIKPGVPLLHLHGKQKQMKRVEIFEKFKRMNKVAMFCTDIAARGLDFPAVDWVVQADCPEDCDTYLHRVGRTARYDAAGKGLLFLLPSEAPEMTKALSSRNIPIKEISPKSNKLLSVSQQLQHFCFQDAEIKYLGQRAFVTYIRSVYLQKNKSVFNVEALPLEQFAESLGLPGTPKIKFVKTSAAKNKSYELSNLLSPEEREKKRKEEMAAIERENTAVHEESDDEKDSGADEDTKAASKPKTRMEKMFARKNAGVLADHYQKLVDHTDGCDTDGAKDSGDDDNDFITLKRADHNLSGESESEDESSSSDGETSAISGNEEENEGEEPVVKTIAINPDTGLPVVIPNIPSQEMTKKQLLKVKQKVLKNMRNTKLVFDDEGNARPIYQLQNEESFRQQGDVGMLVDEFQQRNKSLMEQADMEDRETARQKRKEKKLAKKQREREEMYGSDGEYGVAVLKSTSEDEGMDVDDGAHSDADSQYSSSNYESADEELAENMATLGRKRSFAESDSKNSEEDTRAPAKRRSRVLEIDNSAMSLEDQERLALQLLEGN